MASQPSINLADCAYAGLTGAVGAIPGTLCAHPLDVLKIRMQTTTSGSYHQAIQHIMRNNGYRGFYAGIRPGIEQRFLQRGPMFFVSEAYTQVVTKYTGLEGLSARYSASVASGYTVGFLGGIAEYRKKLLSQQIMTAEQASWRSLGKACLAPATRAGILRRFHGAGLCAAVYDSTFFGTQLVLSSAGLPAPLSFGGAAAAAVCIGFIPDAAVARMLVVPPTQAVITFPRMCMQVVKPGFVSGFRGLPARVGEYFVSYFVTGCVAAVVAFVR
mmetsp:Transcript_74033/g.197378  ORF Transcript_74033/g.197378 Transcript_74033/m.197378 type:complete len:272 (-) Transcript_74033:183-998(-)